MNYYGNCTTEQTVMEKNNIALARKAAREGYVLLKNDGVLPIQNKRVALYGMGARKTIAGGEGSGDVAPRYKVSIEQGLENAGYVIGTKAWLDDYDNEYEKTYEEYRVMVEEKIAHIQNPVQQIPLAHQYKYRYPSGRLITEDDVKKSNTDTAIYVLMRQAGECADRKNEAGDFKLTQIEIDNLSYLAKKYRSLTLIINVGGLVDLTPLDSIEGIGAIVFYVQGGMEGGNALADLLSGEENFSGRLADSWPMSYDDIPDGENFSSLNDNLEQEYYTEGLYVGYRYYDSFGVKPRYPFGYGLSYTSFDTKIKQVSIDKTQVVIDGLVENTGIVAGKEVIQVYLSVPGDVTKALVAFTKTASILAGKSQRFQITFDLRDCGIWSEEESSWMLPSGEYAVCVGKNSQDYIVVAGIEVDTNIMLEKCKSMMKQNTVEEIIPENTHKVIIPEAATRLSVSANVFTTKIADYFPKELVKNANVENILDRLTVEEMIELVRGGDLQSQNSEQHQIMGAGGKTCITLLDRQIPNVLFSDGPAGINIMEEVVYGPDGSQKTAKIPEKYNWGLMKKMSGRFVGSEGQHVYRYATAWPVEELLAQTWNTELLEQIGYAIGEEMLLFGITLWLAPGMNIHRNPLCGRTFEYYSEDPLVTGKMAAALTRGVQTHSGIGVTMKHFCCNNQEDNRAAVSSNVNERTLRQIYLKGFEIATKDANPKAIMTSYNKLGGTYTGERKELVTDVLKGEWGFSGLVMTDWDTRYDALKALNAGVDLMMPGCDKDRDTLLKANEAGLLNVQTLRERAAKVLLLIEDSAIVKNTAV